MPTGIYKRTKEMYDSRRGRLAWSLGLTKETDVRLKNVSEFNSKWNLEHADWLSEKAKKQWANLSDIEKKKIFKKRVKTLEDKNYFKSDECKESSRKGGLLAVKASGGISNRWKDRYDEMIEGSKKGGRALKGIPKNFGYHHEAVEEEIKNFESDGFRCINLCRKPIPDFIAIKDGKPFAVEIAFGKIKTKKYLNNDPNRVYADIIWIAKKRKGKK